MANTGLLPFVRGIDFTCNDFSDDKFPDAIRYMTGLQWLRLDKTNLTDIPEELGKLMKLENLSIKKNNLEKLFGELTELKCLRSLNVRHNRVKSSGIPAELFRLEDLTTLDLSHNRLKDVPEGLDKAKSLLVLNLSHNKIESIPPTLFVQLTDLLFLDLSDNLLETLPPQTRRLANLQTLILNDNPLGLFQLRQLPSLQSLETLHMRNTQRTLANLPTSLDALTNLSDVDLSKNALTKVPDALYSLQNLKRLNLSDNEIAEVSSAMDIWVKLESLNLSRNKLTALPASLCKLQNLRRLHVDDNKLDFEGIPSGIGKLGNMEVFSAANNVLEMIPEGLCRCGSLKKLNLSCNKLITLPDAIHLLSDLENLQLHGNPDLVMPPKPVERPRGAGLQYYNIDFSLQAQLQMAGAATAEPTTPSVKSDPIARKLRLRRGRPEPEQRDSALILRGMQEQANTQHTDAGLDQRTSELKPKRWDETLEKPPLDYSEFFDEDTGQTPGLQVWEIENFIPAPVDEVAHGKFFEGDCYIVLKTSIEEQGQLSWDIHFWIGSKASLDKGACAAMHAVNLRNLLGAKRTQRHEQGDEAPEFLALFPIPPVYIQGSHTPSGFFTVDDPHYVTRLYRVHGAGNSIHLEPVPVQADSLDSRYVFVLDTGLTIYLWNGKKAKNTLKSKARLFAEKINKEERKNKAELIAEPLGKEPRSFWEALGFEGDTPFVPQDHVPEDFVWAPPRLYRVELGMGYLELPQPEATPLARGVLATRNVYILDAHIDVFVWFGKKSSRLVRAAAVKLAQELFNMVKRPPHALVTRLQEGTETQVFKTYFLGWDEVIAVDFTRTAESVARTGADLASWAKQQETKADLSALFTPRQPPMPSTEAKTLTDEWNEDLEAMEAFVLEGRHFVRLPDNELGVFYSCDCYVFLCRYVLPAEMEDDSEASAGQDIEENEGDAATWVVYFWQGRRAPNMGWLTFTFGLERKFKQLCRRLDVVRTHQQQESLKFMAHFNRRFIIRDGKRNLKPETGNQPVELFELRSNGSALCTRLVQVKADASQLNSAFCYILNVPLEGANDTSSAIVYAWIGSKADADAARLIEQIAEEKFNNPWVSLQVLTEGSEPDNFFWVALGGRKEYDTDAEFLNYTRLFRCSNEKGYFTVSEKCTDFCQDRTEVDEPAPFEISDIPQTSGGNISSCEKFFSEISPSTSNNRKHYKRKRNPEAHEAYEVMKKLQSQMKPKDDCDVFAENVACQLRQITDTRSQMIAKHRINQVLFEIGMSQFDIYSNPPSNRSSGPSSAGLDHQFTPIADALAVVSNVDNGPKGCGKSLLITQLASLLGYTIEPIVLYQDMTARDLVQQRTTLENGDTVWRNSALVDAALKGHMAVLDGLHRLHASTLAVLHRLVHDRELQLHDGTRLLRHDRYDDLLASGCTQQQLDESGVKRIHPAFRIVALAEPPTLGRGQHWLSPELLSLFIFHEMRNLSKNEEIFIINTLYGDISQPLHSIINLADQLRTSEDSTLKNLSSSLSTRQLLRIASRMAQYPTDSAYETIQQTFLAKFLPNLARRALDGASKKLGIEPPNKFGIFGGKPTEKKVSCTVQNGVLTIGNTTTQVFKTDALTKVPDILFYDVPQHVTLLEWLLQDFLLGNHLLLVGNQGVGKNKIADRLLQLLNRPREYIQLHRDTTVQSLTVQPTVKDGIVVYEDSPLVKAVKFGHILVVDEADKAPTHVTCILKTLVENGEMILSDGRRIVPKDMMESSGGHEGSFIPVHDDFRMIVLANRPGFPFLGNDFFASLGDLFSCHAVDNPSIESEMELLRSYGPDVPHDIMKKLVQAFAVLRDMADQGQLTYPYSTRELVNIVKHLQKYPEEDLATAIGNVFDFDRYSKDMADKLLEVLHSSGLPTEGVLDGRSKEALKKLQMTVERKSGLDVSSPKHGKEDPDNKPHVGGNTWAGGTGGRDTAGLGGKGGPYRLDKGHDVHQLSDAEKDDIPEHVKKAARDMNRKAFEERLKEIKMSEYDAKLYGQFLRAVQPQIGALRGVLAELQAKKKERQWSRHQTSGELDDGKIIEGLTGERSIYRRRTEQEPPPGAPPDKPKRLRLVLDVSGSMYRFNSYDGRLERSMEAVVLLTEALQGYESRIRYDVYAHSGEEYALELVRVDRPPENEKQRLEIIRTMHAHAQFCWSGDNTLPAARHAIDTLATEDTDESILIILSDANLRRYGIRPEELGSILTSDPRVQAHVIFIGSLGDEAKSLLRQLPAGHAHVCFDVASLPHIMQQIFASSLLQTS